MALQLGTRLGPYEIQCAIGAGGMGEVYRALDTNLGRQVAIKVLPDTFARDPERLVRFEREAKTLASLNHPNIAVIHGLEKANGIRALVMELVEGPTLADRIAQGPIAVDEALPIAKQIAEALEAAHEQGIIHRDLKPANLKIRPDGTVKVLDFGLAKALDPTPGGTDASQSPTITSPAMTRLGVILGTAAYMAPEQARGKVVDKRADIWAFGCVLYEMLTGRRAFEDEDVSMTLSKVLQREPDFDALSSNLPGRVRQTLHVCLQKDLRKRASDIHDVRLALEGAFETSQAAQSHGLEQPLWRRARPIAATAVVAVLLTGLAAWSLWPSVGPQPALRFYHDLAADQGFRSIGRPVLALSPDGRHFVYNTTAGLFLRSMGALEARVIPGTEGPLVNPFFAPDGETVGFWQGGQLKRISVRGGAAVVICAARIPFGASWGKDNTILFGQESGIMRVAANGGTPELVVPSKEGEQVYGPQLLPDRDSVLFSVTTASGATRWDEAQIVVQSLSTRQRTVVLQGSDARYLPTGHLLYALRDALFAVAFDVGQLQVGGGPVSVVEGVARAGIITGAANYGVSDGGILVYVRSVPGGFVPGSEPLARLVWVDRKGREEPLPPPARRYVYARLSPDGTRVAVDIRDHERDIWLWDLRRQIMTRVTFDAQLDGLPVWSPDARRLVWTSQRDGPNNLYWQAADGTGTVERLTESPNTQRASSFTPDGRRLLLSETAGTASRNVDLGLLPLAGDRRVTWLVKTRFSELNGEISPDGRWLAYESDESGQFEIYVRPFPAVDQGRWLVSMNGGRQPLWARSGQELFYLAPDGTLMGVPVRVAQGSVNLGAGTPAKLAEGSGYYNGEDPNLGRTYDVSPDGARFLRIKVKEGVPNTSGAPSRVVVVQSWFEELKRLVPTH